VLLFSGEYAESPKGLKVGDWVKIDVDAQRLEGLQKERDAWDPELTKVRLWIITRCSQHVQLQFCEDYIMFLDIHLVHLQYAYYRTVTLMLAPNRNFAANIALSSRRCI